MELDADEDLGRGVFSRRRCKRARNGNVDMDIFLEREDADSISVDRMDHASVEELAGWSEERGRSREPSQEFYGWAVLKVQDAERNDRTVVASPTLKNRCHADIFLNITGEERRRRQKQHAVELAAHAHWLDAPEDSDVA